MEGVNKMGKYLFKVSDSSGNAYRMEVNAPDFETARNRAIDNCYRYGFCFLGRI
jgi:hypothetical protein